MTIVSFSLKALARLGVPPGKWFCLARTGLGYDQYSCCVCGAHHEAFMRGWKLHAHEPEWKVRLDHAVEHALREMHYYDPSEAKFDRTGDVEVVKSRITELVTDRSNYIVIPAFSEFIKKNPEILKRVRIVTNGPRCLPEMIFPQLKSDQIIANKDGLATSYLQKLSDVHVGTNESDLRLPQVKLLVNHKLKNAPHPGIRIVPRLDINTIQTLFS